MCSQPFETNFNNKIFCSNKCKDECCKFFPRRVSDEKKCIICDNIFTPKRESTNLCSRKCIDISYNNKRPRKTDKRYHETLAIKKKSLNKEQLEIIYGSILGDGFLSLQTDGFHRLSLCHSEKQLDYLKFKMSKLSIIFRQKEPNRFVNPEHLYKDYIMKEKVQYHAHSISHPSLTNLYGMCYRNKRQMIDRRFLNLMSETSLLIWFLDDGCLDKRNRNSILCTNSFSISEVSAIKKWLWQRFKLTAKIRTSSGYPIISFSVEETRNLVDILRQSPIFNELPDCMLYKLTIRPYN